MEIFLAPSYGVYILQLMRFARVYSNDSDFKKKQQQKKLVHCQGYRYHKLRKSFSKIFHRVCI